MLKNETAQALYAQVKDLPIIDYHCHLNAREIVENKPLANIAELWLGGDHYKWRLMRMGGVAERYVTGNGSDFEKFEKYIGVLSYAIGSPLYHWSKLELQRYFGVEEEILPENARNIYAAANRALRERQLTPQKILEMSNVEEICIVEDALSEDLSVYDALRDGKVKTRVTPLMRLDKMLSLPIGEVKSRFGAALENFKKAGCKSADFGVEYLDENDVEGIEKYAFLLEKCYENDFAVQLHFGAMRNCNAPAFRALGADTGYDSISEKPYLSALTKAFAKAGEIGRTVIFNLNPSDNAKISTFAANFAGGGQSGGVQMGVAWWFNDHKDGIYRFFREVAATGLLRASVGMLTDSRSFLSYVRHDYFRRLLCSFVGEAVQNGEFTDNERICTEIVKNVCYDNVKAYLS